MTRYRVEPTGRGFWPYCVRAGDGTRELFVGHKKSCERVAAELETAYRDGEFVGGLGCDALLAERDQLRAELEAIRGQQAGWKLVPIEPTAEMIAAGFNAYPCNLARTYRVYVDAAPPPPLQPDAVSVPSDTALRRAAKFLAGIDNGCNEVKTLRALVENAQGIGAVSVPRELLERISLSRPFEQARYQAIDELRAILSTKNAEEV